MSGDPGTGNSLDPGPGASPPDRKRSNSDESGKPTKKTKPCAGDPGQSSAVTSQDEETAANVCSSDFRDAEKNRSNTVQENLRPSNNEKDHLIRFWHSSIYECLACEENPSKKFSIYSWCCHIKNVHNISRSDYTKKFGNPDVTNFKHSCYLCGTKFGQLYTIIKNHLKTVHKGMTVEDYTNQFKENILLEQALQPVLPSNQVLPGWTEGCEYTCSLCTKTVHSTSQLESHKKSDHKGAGGPSGDEILPSLVRYHTCYLCEKKLRHEHKNIYHHLHTSHKVDINSYANKYHNFILIELKVKGMQDVLDRALDVASRPSLAEYLAGKQLARMQQKDKADKVMEEWADFCQYRCFCEESFPSQLKFYLHVTRKHGFKSMPAYKLKHGDPSVVHRLHKCKLCNLNIKWEASRIRDHLKKHKNKSYTLQQYQEQFRQEIIDDYIRLQNESNDAASTEPFRFRQGRYGGTKTEYTPVEWKEFISRKNYPFKEVECPSCNEVLKQSSLYRHVKIFHPDMMRELHQHLKQGKDIDDKWRKLNLMEGNLENIEFFVDEDNVQNFSEDKKPEIEESHEKKVDAANENKDGCDIPESMEQEKLADELEDPEQEQDSQQSGSATQDPTEIHVVEKKLQETFEEKTEEDTRVLESEEENPKKCSVEKSIVISAAQKEDEDTIEDPSVDDDQTENETEDIEDCKKAIKPNSIFVIDPKTGEITVDSVEKLEGLPNVLPVYSVKGSVYDQYRAADSVPGRLLQDEESETDSEAGSLAGRIMFLPAVNSHVVRRKSENGENVEKQSSDDSKNDDRDVKKETGCSEGAKCRESRIAQDVGETSKDKKQTDRKNMDMTSEQTNNAEGKGIHTKSYDKDLEEKSLKGDSEACSGPSIMKAKLDSSANEKRRESVEINVQVDEINVNVDRTEFTVLVSEDGKFYQVSRHIKGQNYIDENSPIRSCNEVDISKECLSKGRKEEVNTVRKAISCEAKQIPSSSKNVMSTSTTDDVDFQVVKRLDNDIRCYDNRNDDSSNICNRQVSELNLVQDFGRSNSSSGNSMLSNILNDRSFQSIILGQEGGVQRITVLHRKEEENTDKSALLTHISNLIRNQNMDNEANNLKIIEIQVETASQNHKSSHQRAVVRNRSKGGPSKNSHGFSIKTISLPTQHENNTVSKGTQICKWTKIGEELQKVAPRNILEGKPIKAAGSSSGYPSSECGSSDIDPLISAPEVLQHRDGSRRRSVATQVVWENRVRGVVDLDEENEARDKIADWFISSPPDIEKARTCPGCNKTFSRNRNLLQHLQTKHGVHLTGGINDEHQRRMQMDNCNVTCKHCGVTISRKSLRRHERQLHSGTNDNKAMIKE